MATAAITLANQATVCKWRLRGAVDVWRPPPPHLSARCVITSYPLLNIFSASACTCGNFCKWVSAKTAADIYSFGPAASVAHGSPRALLRVVARGYRYRVTSNAMENATGKPGPKCGESWQPTTIMFFFSPRWLSTVLPGDDPQVICSPHRHLSSLWHVHFKFGKSKLYLNPHDDKCWNV